MHMISHQAIGKQAESAELPTPLKQVNEPLVVFRIQENLLTIDPSQHNMINTAFTLLSGSSRHLHHHGDSIM